ncbi:anaphase-promoting complex subunit 1-like protein, partial [Dinothrombium tinctorium]
TKKTVRIEFIRNKKRLHLKLDEISDEMIIGGNPQLYTPYGKTLLASHPQDNGCNFSSLSTSVWICAENETSRDLFRAMKAVSLKDHSAKEEWLLRRCEEGEEELYFSLNVLTLSRCDGKGSAFVIKTFTLGNNIQQAVWTSFEDEHKSFSAICALDCNSLEVYSDEGDHFPIGLPFQISRLLSNKYGLLLEREPLSSEFSSTETPMPLLFSLTHPLKDISPVIMKSSSFFLTYLTLESKLELVGICEDWNLCLFYHKTDGYHSVCIIRKATDKEINSMVADNISLLENTSANDSPFTIHFKQCSQTTLLASSTTSPFRSASTTKQSFSISSPSNTSSNQKKSSQLTSSSSYLSPLRSSRLGASPGSPLLRGFSPSVDLPQTKTYIESALKHETFSPSNTITPRRGLDIELSDDTNEPIYPEITIENRWTEPQPSHGKASKVFVSCDLMGQHYFVYLLSTQQQLKLVKFDESNDGKRLIFGTICFISGKDAEPIRSLNMILTLDLLNNFVLYSGLYKVSVVHIPSILIPHNLLSSPSSISKSFQSPNSKRASLFASSRPASEMGFCPRFSIEGNILSPVVNSSRTLNLDETNASSASYQTITNITAIKNVVGNRVVIENFENNLFSFYLPPISNSSIVTLCINALKTILPKDCCMQFLTKWYGIRNSPGSVEMTDCSEINMFKYSLLCSCGYDIEKLPFELNISDVDICCKSPSMIKKLKLESTEKGTDEDWNFILGLGPRSDSLTEESYVNSSAYLFTYLPSILYALHLVYEELQLNSLTADSANELLDILYLFASDLKQISYQDYYWRNSPNVCFISDTVSRISEDDMKLLQYPSFFTESHPSVFIYIKYLMKTESFPSSVVFSWIAEATQRIRTLILLYACFRNNQVTEKDYLLPIAPFRSSNLSEFNLDVEASVEQRLILCMEKLGVDRNELQTYPPGLVAPLWNAIFKCRHDPSAEWSSTCYSLIGRPDLVMLLDSKTPKYPMKADFSCDTDNDDDGLNGLNKEILRLLFPEDQRVFEAYTMLQSSKPVKIALLQRPGVTDHDFIEEQERHLYTLCIRTMALPIGRGMFTLKTYKPVVAETFPIPKLCLSGRVPPRNTTVELSHIDVPANMNTWPMFHNGVAAGLRVSPSSSDAINSAWIIYNKPKINSQTANDSQNEHAGFLLGLGLNNHITKLSMMHIHDYLSKGNELTRVAVLLGLAAAKRGTMDMFAVKILSIHVEALLPPTSTELDVPPIVQVAAVLGIGLVYQGSGQTHIAEILLSEIGRPPGPEMEHYIDRESYALAAGLAFGFVTLGKGNEMISLVSSAESMSMADQLCNYMIGGHKRPLTNVQKEKYKTPSYQIREGDYVNADVTSPGATLALGMMFFNTSNEAVANWVTAPDTQYLLETVRPDFLMLRVLCKGLIMWSEVKPTKEWIESHIPSIVAKNALNVDVEYDSMIDYETMAQVYCNIVAGACMVLGLKYAGSSNQQAFESVMGFTKMFLDFPKEPIYAERAGRSTIESCLNVLVVSLAMIMAGTGNVKVMRICRYLRSRISQVNVVLYGSHMATHMALGLLFLGGCRYTLRTSPEAIAALICSFFPKYPIHSNDNRYHLQAFRHLYVLAAEPRLVIPRDIDTGQYVYAHLLLKYRNNCEQENEELVKVPAFLPELHLLEEVILLDERYWKISFKRDKNFTTLESFLSNSGILYVKQKVGCLPYEKDSQGYKSIHAQCLLKDAVNGWSFKPTTLNEFSSDPILINFASHQLVPKAQAYEEAILQHNLCRILFDCASNETIDLLPTLITFLKMINPRNENHGNNSYNLWQVKLLIDCSSFCSCLRSDFLQSLIAFAERKTKGKNVLCFLISYNIPFSKITFSSQELCHE